MTEKQQIKPVWGQNYGRGYIGFSFPAVPGARSHGISWFTRWDRMSDIRVTHALVVTGERTCVEALVNGGVVESPLEKYFSADFEIFFRKPRSLDWESARQIAAAAFEQLGTKYDKRLMYGHALNGSFLGRLAGVISAGVSRDVIAAMLDNPEAWICSEIAAWALDQCIKYQGVGCLSGCKCAISPQRLFEDDELFQPWKEVPAWKRG